MAIARKMCAPASMLANEYCCFDEKVKSTAKFTTLTASIYHPFLQKQAEVVNASFVNRSDVGVSLMTSTKL